MTTQHRGLVVARNGAVAASQPLAVSAGLAVLAQGGSFADAAIATSAVLCVIEPQSSHLGGDAFLVVYDADTRQTIAVNGSGAAPASANPNNYAGGIPVHGLRAATVPGLVSTWFALHERYGKIPIAELLAPAIEYAESGFPAGPRLVRACGMNADLFAARPTLPGSLGLKADLHVGEMVFQPDLAWTLKEIAMGGREAFYRGTIAARIAAHAATHAEGHFTAEDFAAHQTRVLPPLTARYRDYTIHGQPPPSQGLILLEELAIAQGFDLATMDEGTRTHILVEAKKLAFADRNAFLGDPVTAPVPTQELISEAYAAQRRKRINLNRAAPDYTAGDPIGGTDTTYFLTADRKGNAVSFIQSVFHVFGSGEVAEGTGILFNNRLTGFSLDPASPNFLAPNKRPAHTLNAWLATDADGKLAFVGGTPGGHVQVQTNAQLIINLVDKGLNAQEAVEAWRWQHLPLSDTSAVSGEQAGPGILEIEDRADAETITALREKGHDVCLIGPWAHGSSAQVLAVLPGGAYSLGSDPRCDGHAAGL